MFLFSPQIYFNTKKIWFSENTVKVMPIKADDIQAAVRVVEKNSGLFFVQQKLILERESLSCSDSSCPTVCILCA